MRTYKEYYKIGLEKHNRWFGMQKDEWWKKGDEIFKYEDENFEYRKDHLNILGDYIETVSFKSRSERNDASIFDNHTNVSNKEWDILFDMLGQALIDWCIENEEEKIYAYNITINRELDGNSNILNYKYNIKIMDEVTWNYCEDENKLKKFDDCSTFLINLIERFITEQGKDIPNDWNYFGFGLDSISESCKYKVWTPESDGWMSLGCCCPDENFVTYVHAM